MESCKSEGIKDEDLAEILGTYLRKVQGEKATAAYWDKVREDRTMQPMTAEQMLSFFLHNYKKQTGTNFQLDKYTTPVIEALCLYFTNDPKFEELDPEFSLKKGIMLHGNVGTGKTSIMNAFWKNQRQSFKVISCMDVAGEYSKDGYDAIKKYSSAGMRIQYKYEYFNQEYFTFCLDDLGVETEKKFFGNESNVIGELIHLLYERRTLVGNIHFTTNLNAKQIKEVYGARVASRLREMINLIAFNLESPDRRV